MPGVEQLAFMGHFHLESPLSAELLAFSVRHGSLTPSKRPTADLVQLQETWGRAGGSA